MASNSNLFTIDMSFPGKDEIIQRFRTFGTPAFQAKYLAAAVKEAAKPMLPVLRRNTPRGPTGNLKKAVSLTVRKYTNRGFGAAVSLVGYTRPRRSRGNLEANEKGHAQHFVEFGTGPRKTKESTIASSYRSRGKFLIGYTRRKKIGDAVKATGRQMKAHVKRTGSTVMTKPKYPYGFFKKGKAGKPVELGRMPLGGKAHRPPLKLTWQQCVPTLKSRLNRELMRRISNATREMLLRNGRGTKP